MKENKKISSENMDEKGYIKSILQNEFSLAEDIAENISLRLAQGLIKKIEIKILETDGLFVKFECNLSTLEMEERKNEVRVFLPQNSLSDDYMYRIQITEPPRRAERDGWWIYYAFV